MMQQTAARHERRAVSGRPRPGAALVERLAEDLDGVFQDVVVEHQPALFASIAGLPGAQGGAGGVVRAASARAPRALGGSPAARPGPLSLRPGLFRIPLTALRNRL